MKNYTEMTDMELAKALENKLNYPAEETITEMDREEMIESLQNIENWTEEELESYKKVNELI